MRIVFDIDDTICDNNFRDYGHEIPFENVINKINKLYNEGHYIILYTSRGMISCNNDINKILKKYDINLREWLKNHNVKYHELVFGKPIADLYVDDKCMNVQEFLNAEFKDLKGGSNSSIIRYGEYVKKTFNSHEEVVNFKKWYNLINNLNFDCYVPKVVSYVYQDVYMEYIDGQILNESINKKKLKKLISLILNFKSIKYNSFNLQHHIDKLSLNKDGINDNKIELCINLLKSIESKLINNASFSHSDLILSNVIDKNNKFYLLDTQMSISASTYLSDFAKLRMSLDNYEYKFKLSKVELSSKLKKVLDKTLKKLNILNEVLILEYMYILRLFRYKNENEKVIIYEMLTNLEKELNNKK